MTVHFQMRREDVLEFTRQFYAASPTYRQTRFRLRLMLPAIMIVLWGFTTSRSGFEWSSTISALGVALLWFFLYPYLYDRSVRKYCEKIIDEGSYSKNFGDCVITLSESGIHSIAPSGESKFPWSSVDRTLLTETYFFIFLNGPIGYPIPIADIGRESAVVAYEFVNQHIENKKANRVPGSD